MIAQGRLLSLLLLLMHAFAARGDEAGKTTLYVCEAGDPTFMGAFLQGSETMDGRSEHASAVTASLLPSVCTSTLSEDVISST